jgi:hypothetical protein
MVFRHALWPCLTPRSCLPQLCFMQAPASRMFLGTARPPRPLPSVGASGRHHGSDKASCLHVGHHHRLVLLLRPSHLVLPRPAPARGKIRLCPSTLCRLQISQAVAHAESAGLLDLMLYFWLDPASPPAPRLCGRAASACSPVLPVLLHARSQGGFCMRSAALFFFWPPGSKRCRSSKTNLLTLGRPSSPPLLPLGSPHGRTSAHMLASSPTDGSRVDLTPAI